MGQKLQLNINKDRKTLHYMVDVSNSHYATNGAYGYHVWGDNVQFIRYGGLPNVIRDMNVWSKIDGGHPNMYVPSGVAQKHLQFYIPIHSMEKLYDDTFVDGNELSGLKYILTAYTFINGHEVVLGSRMFDSLDAVAVPQVFSYKGHEYRSMVEMDIVDPAILTYSDDWADFRHFVCGEEYGVNNTGSVMNVDLYVVTPSGDYYLEATNFVGCSAGMTFSRYKYDKLQAELSFNGDATISLLFNDEYKNDLWTYLRETYNMKGSDCYIAYELVVHDKDNIYFAPTVPVEKVRDPNENHWLVTHNPGKLYYTISDWNNPKNVYRVAFMYWYEGVLEQHTYYDIKALTEEDAKVEARRRFTEEYQADIYEFITVESNEVPIDDVLEIDNQVIFNENLPVPHHTFERKEFNDGGIVDWSWYTPGMNIQGCVYIFRPNYDDEVDVTNFDDLMEVVHPSIELLTNEIPLTPENYKFLMPLDDKCEVEELNLDYIDMQEYNLHVVNKIRKEVININRPDDYKANIIRPVFVRTMDQKDIVIHPEVTENISFNLHRYKSMVEMFHIKIEGVDFIEIGRTDSTIIFRIDGTKLPHDVDEGTYFILNEKFETVTSGKYRYE